MGKTKEKVVYRDFRKSDVTGLLEVARQSFAEEFEIGGFDTDYIAELINRIFSVSGRTFLFFLKRLGRMPFKVIVAEAEGRIVGTAMVTVRGRIGYVSTVMVHPLCRRQGIALKLVESALNYIQQRRLTRALLHVMSKNTAAKGVYTALGFKKFENIVYFVGEVESLLKPRKMKDVQIRRIKKKDIDGVWDLISHCDNPARIKIVDLRKQDLKVPFVDCIFRFSRNIKLVAVKEDMIVGYVAVSFTTAEEAGRISGLVVCPTIEREIEDDLIHAGLQLLDAAGIQKVFLIVDSERTRTIENAKQLGFSPTWEMDGMVRMVNGTH